MKRNFVSMRPDGKISVDVRELLRSERVRKDLGALRVKLGQADERRFNDKDDAIQEISEH